MEIAEIALRLPFKEKKLETVNSFKSRRNIADSFEIDAIRRSPIYSTYTPEFRVEIPELEREQSQKIHKSIPDAKVPEKTVSHTDINEQSQCDEIEVNIAPTQAKSLRTKDEKIADKIESQLKVHVPLLCATRDLMENRHEGPIVDRLISLVRNRDKLIKNQYKPVKAKVPPHIREKAEITRKNEETRLQVHQLIKSKKIDRIENLLGQINISTSSSRPAEVKKMFLDLETKSRAQRTVPTKEELVKLLAHPAGARNEDVLMRISDYLHNTPIFKDKPSYAIEQLCNSLVLETKSSGATLFRQGDPGDKYYYILEGSVQLTVTKPGYVYTDLNAPQNAIAVMKAGEAFGDHALLNNLNRSTSAFANEDNTLLITIDKEPFVRCMGVAYQVQIRDRMNFLRKCNITASVDTKGLKLIAQKLFPRIYKAGATIIAEQELSDSIFFVKRGTCAVYRDFLIGKKVIKYLVGEMKTTDTFNEECVFHRSFNRKGSGFTVVAITEVEIYNIVGHGEWTTLNLKHTQNPFGLISTEELQQRYRAEQYRKRFKEYQQRYVRQLKAWS